MFLEIHHGTFVNVPLKSAHKKKASSFSFICDIKNFQIEKYTNDLSQNFSNFSGENSDQVDSLFNKYISIFAAVVDKHAPLKQASKKTITTKAVIVYPSAEIC